jgi:hypothetical protein
MLTTIHRQRRRQLAGHWSYILEERALRWRRDCWSIWQSFCDRLVSRSCRATRAGGATVWSIEINTGRQTDHGQHVVCPFRVDLGGFAL